MLDFSHSPLFDNHCHPIDPRKATLTPERLAREFYHGLSDEPAAPGQPWDASAEVWSNITNLGVVQTMVCQLASVLGCEPELEAVAAARNQLTAQSYQAYINRLYRDARIIATVVDSDLPQDSPVLNMIPGRIMRLFQMGPVLQQELKAADSYPALARAYQDRLERAIRHDGFVGVKAHLAEEVGFGVDAVSPAEAASAFAAAKTGDAAAYKRLYVACFVQTMLLCQELGVPVHVHSGITGGLWQGPIGNADPFLLVPLIRRPDLLKTRLVFLHGGYPWIQHAAAVAHALPNVWVDLGWTTPWISLRLAECYRDLIGMAPLSKLLVGSGGHGTPEIAWLAAKTAKIAVREALSDAVRQGMLVETQAERIGQMILHGNGERLYGLATSGE